MNKISLAFVLLLFSACTDEQLFSEDTDFSSEQPISINVPADSFSKGALVGKPKDMGSIGVYCAMTQGLYWDEDTKFDKLENTRFDVTSTGDWQIVGEPETWGFENVSDKYTFMAYSPYDDVEKGVSSSINKGELVIDYKVPQNSALQPDLMFAEPRKNIYPQTTGSSVALTFHHALASISFSVVTSLDVTIDSIKISGVVSDGSVQWDYGANAPVWSFDTYSSDTLVVDIGKYELDDNDSARVNSDMGYLMMIPQSLENGAEVTVTLSNNETKYLKISEGTQWKANYKYNYVIRLEEEDDNCFIYESTQLSNCYIINAVAGEEAIVQIPIQDRINDFWTYYVGKKNEMINSSKNMNKFSIVMLWEDFDGDVTFTPEFVEDENGKLAALMSISSEKQEGNLVFAVKKRDSDNYDCTIWSWHLWFTEYNPDAIAAANKIVIGVDSAYTLTNYLGAVHRYVDDPDADDSTKVWAGMYKNKYIMDRNIGARNQPATTCGAGTLYYQYGCKDPLPGEGAIYSSDNSTSFPTKWLKNGVFSDAVEYAEYFVHGSESPYNWCNEKEARFALNIWYDYKLPASTYTEGKSIFDPSPLGWRIPVLDTWKSFDQTGSKQSCSSDFSSVGVYYPYGCIDPSESIEITNQDVSLVWSANQYAASYGYCFYNSASVVCNSGDYTVTHGLSVRSIQE